MHFLHTDAQKAADSICDQDCERYFHVCVANLCIVSEGRMGMGMIHDWLKVDSMNYHWLAYFCDCLNGRVENGVNFHKVKLLRVCSPTIPRVQQLTPFPYVHSTDRKYSTMATEQLVAEYRTHYVQNRFKRAEWKKTGVPSWFVRLGNTILPEGERPGFLLRYGVVGLGSADNLGSEQSQRNDVREQPLGTLDGGPAGQVTLW